MHTITAHLAHLTRVGHRPATIAARRWALLRLARWVDGPILTTDLDTLRAFTARDGRGAQARANEVSHLRAFYRWAHTEEIIAADPTVRLERPSVPRRKPRPMPHATVTWALTNAPTERIGPFLTLAAYAGLRACEIAVVHGHHVDALHTGWLHVPDGKGGTDAEVRLSPPLTRLAARMPRGDWWFPREDGTHAPTSPGRVSRLANRWLHDHDIDHTLHSLRHFYGTELRRRGGMLVAKHGLRHRSIQSTEMYTALEDDELATAADGIVDLTSAA